MKKKARRKVGIMTCFQNDVVLLKYGINGLFQNVYQEKMGRQSMKQKKVNDNYDFVS